MISYNRGTILIKRITHNFTGFHIKQTATSDRNLQKQSLGQLSELQRATRIRQLPIQKSRSKSTVTITGVVSSLPDVCTYFVSTGSSAGSSTGCVKGTW